MNYMHKSYIPEYQYTHRIQFFLSRTRVTGVWSGKRQGMLLSGWSKTAAGVAAAATTVASGQLAITGISGHHLLCS